MYEELKEFNETLVAAKKEFKENSKILIENAFVELFEKHSNLSSVKWRRDRDKVATHAKYEIMLTSIPNSKFNNVFYYGNLKKAKFKGLSDGILKSIKNDIDNLFVTAGAEVLNAFCGNSLAYNIATINGISAYKAPEEEYDDGDEDDEDWHEGDDD